MAGQFVGEVRCVGFNFPPSGWAYCDGQLLAISSNTALFSLLGTYYGGDGRATFGLPNLQGNVAISQGTGGGLSQRDLGETGGEQTVTLLQSEIPSHNHNYMVVGVGTPANSGTPTPTAAISHGTTSVFSAATTPLVAMNANAVGINGGGLPHNNMMPYLVLNFVIAMQGVFPPRG